MRECMRGNKNAAGNKGKPKSPEHRAKISAALRGKNNPQYGKKANAAQRAALALGHDPFKPGKDHPVYGKFGRENPNWSEVPTPWAVHARLRRERGSASNYPCIECGERREYGATGEDSMNWSYDYGAPDEMLHAGYGAYSADPDFYSPRCAFPCHFQYDFERSGRGHSG
jgi:hypothetical protein